MLNRKYKSWPECPNILDPLQHYNICVKLKPEIIFTQIQFLNRQINRTKCPLILALGHWHWEILRHAIYNPCQLCYLFSPIIFYFGHMAWEYNCYRSYIYVLKTDNIIKALYYKPAKLCFPKAGQYHTMCIE